jgi:hypothetical protein
LTRLRPPVIFPPMTNGLIKGGKSAKKVAYRDGKAGPFAMRKAKRKGGERLYRDAATGEIATAQPATVKIKAKKAKPSAAKKKNNSKKKH